MPKGSGSTGGGGGGGNIFTSNVTGPPPGPLTAGVDDWIPVAIIPTGLKIWFGNLSAASLDKSLTFEVRANVTGQSAGNTTVTTLLASVSASPTSGTKFLDIYKGGRLHITSVVGTGVESVWLHLKSKTKTAGSYYYSLNYTTE